MQVCTLRWGTNDTSYGLDRFLAHLQDENPTNVTAVWLYSLKLAADYYVDLKAVAFTCICTLPNATLAYKVILQPCWLWRLVDVTWVAAACRYICGFSPLFVQEVYVSWGLFLPSNLSVTKIHIVCKWTDEEVLKTGLIWEEKYAN